MGFYSYSLYNFFEWNNRRDFLLLDKYFREAHAHIP